MNNKLREAHSFPEDWDTELAYEDQFYIKPYKFADKLSQINKKDDNVPFEEHVYHSNRDYYSSSINSSY